MFVVDLSRVSSVIADTTPRLSAAQLKAGEKEVTGRISLKRMIVNCVASNQSSRTLSVSPNNQDQWIGQTVENGTDDISN